MFTNDHPPCSASSMAPASGALQKAEGNDHFRAGRYVKAVGSYSAAIAADRTNATYHLNRSQAYLKLDKYEDAARDATSCLSIDSKNTKALFRRALAYKGLGRYVEALNDLKKARVLDGSNPEIEHEITTVQNLLEEQVKAEQKKKAQRTAVVQRGQAAPTTGEGNGSHEPTQASSKASTSKLQAALAPQPGDANSTASESKDDFLRPVTTRRLDRTSSTSTPTPAAGNANATEESVTAQSVDSRHQASSPVRADIDSSSQSKPLSFAAAKEARAQRLAQSRPRTAQVNSGTSYPSLSSPVALPPPAHQASASEPPAALATSIATAYEFSRAWREAKAGTPESSLKCRLQVLQVR